MLVTLKTLQEDEFTVEIDPSKTVKSLKEKIEKVKGDDFPAKSMKLMYAGKFLVDDKKVSDYNVEEKKFVMLVVKKPKPTSTTKDEPEPNTGTRRDRSEPTAQRTADQEMVNLIVELGFTRSEVEAALIASYNNPDRAVEYLINGALPSSTNDDVEPETRRRNPVPASESSDTRRVRTAANSGQRSTSGANASRSRERLMEIFNEAMDDSNDDPVRAANNLFEQNRDLITESLAEIEAAEMIRDPTAPSGIGAGTSFPIGGMGEENVFTNSGMFDSFSDAFHQAHAVTFAGNLLDRDHEAIERLKQLGFSDRKAIEAYFVCDKNENAAAEYLFSHNE